MNARQFPLLLLVIATVSSAAVEINLKVTNPNKKFVANAPVVIQLQNLKNISSNERSQLAVYVDNKQISSQLDDLNKDGIQDELVFLLDLKGKETRKVVIKTIPDSERQKFPPEVYADLILKTKDGEWQYLNEISSSKNDMYNKLHHHGVAFESALIGYRIYFDNKSTVDIYGKKKYRLELPDTEWYPTSEQIAAGYGDDVLRVLQTVGVGTVKGFTNGHTVHIDKFDKRTQRIVALGNLRAVVEWEVEGWEYEGEKINITARYILYARHRDVAVEVRASENINQLATGVQRIDAGSLFSNNKGLVGSWGADYPVDDTIHYEKQTCGLGVYVPKKYVLHHQIDDANNLVIMQYLKNDVLCFHFLAVAVTKEEENKIHSDKEFFTFLKQWSLNLKPVQVKF
ncbi:MAG TPA: DUF4861 domain-containing protein [Paludibacteraceae bacterium]|nr:DUF4861 domain-containing protein [Paludibacteraceae bacterium]HOL00850.1 DUF4861 domain-containing protein [Paludibacteraceae bacterium]HPC26346.1 DUF4861 domain-containing protein [Paludibacteraceae bacterium]HRR62803.1 DUF4861 domain-containing protein [Paludibacteraceae bacterium]